MAKKKAAKKAARKAKSHKVWKMTIASDGSFLEDPIDGVQNGDHVKITIPKKTMVTIKVVSPIEVDPEGGSGGPIIISS